MTRLTVFLIDAAILAVFAVVVLVSADLPTTHTLTDDAQAMRVSTTCHAVPLLEGRKSRSDRT